MTHGGPFPAADFPLVQALNEQASALDEDAFAALYPGHYFITDTAAQDDYAWRQFKTSTVPAVRAGQQRSRLTVAPVAKRDQSNPYTWMVTLGRTTNNDIVLADASISKLHAWIRRHTDASGGAFFSVTDAGSRNGTLVNGGLLRGETSPLPVGARLRLGQVELLFVDGRLLHQALRQPPSSLFSAA